MRGTLALAFLTAPAAVLAQPAPKPLFANDAPIQVKIQGPMGSIARRAAKSVEPESGTLSMTAPAESHPIRISPRGLSRRTSGICDFPPLRVEFTPGPAAPSLFAGQKRLKLVTHCKSSSGHQQYVLLEYSAYRLFNVLSPVSFKVRLATVEYTETSGKNYATRWGFFIEDGDDVAKRNGLKEIRVPDRVATTQLDPAQAGRVALFMYMIGNLDWSMRAGSAGEGCCHNTRLLSATGGTLVSVPYDFDYSGLVDAPYAVPPEKIRVRNVRQRYYQGYCRFNANALAAAAEMRAKRSELEAVYSQIPGMDARTSSKALAYLASFFDEIATDQAVRDNITKNCVAA